MATAYLDHNATTPPYKSVIELVARVMREGGNPSAVYGVGRQARGRVETARSQVAKLANARARDVTFFGSATEAHATLIAQFASALFLRPDSEHDAVLNSRPGTPIPLKSSGVVCIESLKNLLYSNSGPILVAIMAANNETGIIPDIETISQLIISAKVNNPKIHFHIDAVQAAGKFPIDFKAWGCDSLALSSHKMGGPQGVGALVTRPGFDLQPIIRGGGQERRRRAGTENVAGIAGFGLACELTEDMDHLIVLREHLERGLNAINPKSIIVGQDERRLPNTTCVINPGMSSEILLMKFDLAGVALSSGSACSSGRVGGSHVLQAMGINADFARSSLRFSLGRETTKAEVDLALDAYRDICS